MISPALSALWNEDGGQARALKWRHQMVRQRNLRLGGLAGEPIAVEEDETVNWTVRFFTQPVGVIDTKHNRLRRPTARGSTAPNAKDCYPSIRVKM